MQHPNIFDRIFLKINPRYLYPLQSSQTISRVYVSILHTLPHSSFSWKPTDGLYLEAGSILHFLGLAKSLHLEKNIAPDYSVFEVIQANISKSTDSQLHPGDTVCLSPLDRKYIYPLTNRFLFPGVQKSQPAIQKP